MRLALVMSTAIVCAACQTDPEPTKVPPDEYPDAGGAGDDTIIRGVSGSRLRAVYRLGGDGSREFVTWHDSERDEDCAFTEVETSPFPTRRCFPMVGDLIDAAVVNYVDAQCTKRVDPQELDVRLGRDGKPLNAYRLHAEEADDEIRARLFVHGDVYTEASETQPATLKLYRITEAGCEPESPIEVTRPWVYLDEISLDDFVFWTVAVE